MHIDQVRAAGIVHPRKDIRLQHAPMAVTQPLQDRRLLLVLQTLPVNVDDIGFECIRGTQGVVSLPDLGDVHRDVRALDDRLPLPTPSVGENRDLLPQLSIGQGEVLDDALCAASA